MREFSIQCTDTRSFSLNEAGVTLAAMNYANWFSFKSHIIFSSGEEYKMEPQGFWGSIIHLMNGAEKILEFTMHWNGNIVISSKLDGTEKSFVFRNKSIFRSAFLLEGDDKAELMVIEPHFNWSKFNYHFSAKTTGIYADPHLNILMVLVGVHCANYYMMMMTGAMA